MLQCPRCKNTNKFYKIRRITEVERSIINDSEHSGCIDLTTSETIILYQCRCCQYKGEYYRFDNTITDSENKDKGQKNDR